MKQYRFVNFLFKYSQYILRIIAGLFLLSLVSCNGISTFQHTPSPLPSVSRAGMSDVPGISLTSYPLIYPVVTEVLPTETRVPTATVQITPTLLLPSEHYITGIYGHKQFFSLGCEAAVAKDWAAFLGFEINEFNFQYELPLSDNPEKGFVGDVNGPWGQVPPYAYGVHAGPVADLLNKYGILALAKKQMSIDEIKKELAQNQPVIAWVIGNMVGGVAAEYTDNDGDTVIVAAYEHVVLITGYSEDTIRYNSNGKFYDTPTDVFLNSWGVLGNMAIIYDD